MQKIFESGKDYLDSTQAAQTTENKSDNLDLTKT